MIWNLQIGACSPRPAGPSRVLFALGAGLVATCMAWPTHTCAQEPSASYRAFAAQPGAEFSERTAGGEVVHQVRHRGVVLEEIRRPGQVETTVTDRSGHGAVLCSWSIYTSLRAFLRTCNPGQHVELAEDLDWAIDAINHFAAENDPNQRPLLSWQERAALADASFQQRARSDPQACRNPDAAMFIASFLQQSREERRQSVAALLAVPRPPAIAPCL